MTAFADRKKSDPVVLAVKAAGGVMALARALGVSHTAIPQWTRVPTDHLLKIEHTFGVPRHRLRPELYIGYERRAA